MEFSAYENKIIQYVRLPATSLILIKVKNILSILPNTEDKQHQNVSEASRAAGLA